MAPAANGCTSDLPIVVVSRQLVKASNPPVQPHVVAVSNLDIIGNTLQCSIVCPYPKLPKAGDFDAVVAKFAAGLPYMLNHFYPLAGRIVTNPSSGLPELDCRNQGAELVVGEVGVALGSLDYGLATESLKKMVLPFAEDVALSVQLLSFACGGFAVVWGTNHLLSDGQAFTMFVRMWSEHARSGTLAAGVAPSHDRSVIRPRDPPSYSAAVGAMYTQYDDHKLPNVLTAQESFVDRLYYIEAGDIARLREAASAGVGGQQRSSRVQAVSAYLWKVLADVVAASRVPEARCRMLWWVDARRRITAPEVAPAMRNYFGNVTTYAVRDAGVKEIQRKTLAEVAAMVREAITAVDYGENIQELVDWVEEHKAAAAAGGYVETATMGLGSPTVGQTTFSSFPLDTDFGFGEAALAMPVWDTGRLCSCFLSVGARPGGADGSWIVGAYVWPRLAAALESDDQRIFKPLTAEYLGLVNRDLADDLDQLSSHS